MRILVFTPASCDVTALARELGSLGLEVLGFEITEDPSAVAAPPCDIALVIAKAAILELGERVTKARGVIGPSGRLMVCCPQLTSSDRLTIRRCGATKVVTPRMLDTPAAVAERVLGELLLTGEVEPRSFGELRGGTVAMRELYRQIETVAPLDETVLIVGETGTGKERVANEIHRLSGRSGPLMAVNAAELTPELLASELFGHARGAFSGAVERRRGLLVAAGHGTFFLDEIGDLPSAAQAKLLRVVEERKVRPVGSNDWEPVHCRLLLATRRDLAAAREEEFRRDLYERLRGFSIHIPPLRDRRADIPLLIHHFLDQYDGEYPGARSIPEGVIDPLFRHTWPGNVRELRLAVRLAAAYSAGRDGPISARHLLEAPNRADSLPGSARTVHFEPTDTWRQAQERFRASYFRALLDETGANRELAAQRAGLSRSQLYEILKQLG